MMPGSHAELVKEAQLEALRRDVLARGKKLCPFCGLALGADGLCPHHTSTLGDHWGRANRVFCDFFHRKIVLPVDTPAVGDPAVITYDGGAC